MKWKMKQSCANTVSIRLAVKSILSMWSKVDKKLNKRLIESVTQSINIWLNGLMAEEKILGGRVEFLEEENTTADLLAGKAKFHIYLTPPKGTTEVVSVKHILVVTPKKLNPGKVATAAAAEVSGEYAVSYYATYIDGKKKLEIDPLNYIYYVNGKDYLADVRKALGK